jgi:hypothetical protein
MEDSRFDDGSEEASSYHRAPCIYDMSSVTATVVRDGYPSLSGPGLPRKASNLSPRPVPKEAGSRYGTSSKAPAWLGRTTLK